MNPPVEVEVMLRETILPTTALKQSFDLKMTDLLQALSYFIIS
jgi:hypothetical protein